MDSDAPTSPGPGAWSLFASPATLIALALILAHGARVALDPQTQLLALREAAFVPARLWAAMAPETIAARLGWALRESPEAGRAAAFWLGDHVAPWSLITYVGVHLSWAHALSNAGLIALCAAPAARRMTGARFAGFMTTGAVAGAAAQASALDVAFLPLAGASACVCASIGAWARMRSEPGGATRLSPLAESGRRAHGWAAFVAGAAAIAASAALADDPGSIGWRAHLGGYVAGFLCVGAFERRRKTDRA